MGRPKLKTEDVTRFVRLIDQWEPRDEFSWELIRDAYSKGYGVALVEVWSRQSLSKHKAIYSAFLATENRINDRKTNVADEAAVKADKQKSGYDKLKADYDALLARHRQLAYNLSLLDGGKKYLYVPIPSNARAQSEYRARIKKRRNTPF